MPDEPLETDSLPKSVELQLEFNQAVVDMAEAASLGRDMTSTPESAWEVLIELAEKYCPGYTHRSGQDAVEYCIGFIRERLIELNEEIREAHYRELLPKDVGDMIAELDIKIAPLPSGPT